MIDKVHEIIVNHHKLLNKPKAQLDGAQLAEFVERSKSALFRIVGSKSVNGKLLSEITTENKNLDALITESSRICSIAETIHQDLFSELNIPRKWSFFLSGAVIIVALGLVVYLTIQPNLSLFQSRIVLALVCFVLASISGLLFAVTARIQGTIGVLAITIGGPGVLWIAAVLLLQYVFRDNFEAQLPTLVRDIYNQADTKEGWKFYEEWRRKIGGYREVFEKEEEHFVGADLLPRVFYHGVSDDAKLTNPAVDTWFIYGTNTTVKFQRVTGSKGASEPKVYLAATPSTMEGQSVSFSLQLRDNEIINSHLAAHGEWLPIGEEKVDTLIVTFYYNETIDKGDWIYLDVPKYCEFNKMTELSLGLFFVNRSFKSSTTWEMKAASDLTLNPAPLAFRELESAQMSTNVNVSPFSDWFRALDQDRRYGRKELVDASHESGDLKLYRGSVENLWPLLAEALTGNRTNKLSLTKLFEPSQQHFSDVRFISKLKERNGVILLFRIY